MRKGIATLLFGAGLGAAAILFSNKENRRKAIKAYNKFMESTDETISQLTDTAEKTRSNRDISSSASRIKDLLN